MIQIHGSAQLQQLKTLLRDAALPYEDLDKVIWFKLLGIVHDHTLMAAAGLEQCGGALLMRSVITQPIYRDRGFGRQLVEALHQAAKDNGFEEVWLLTTDAGNYFARHHGYEAIDRAHAPEGIENSAQFSVLCPADAWLMRKQLI